MLVLPVCGEADASSRYGLSDRLLFFMLRYLSQSVFLGDITAAYQKNKDLESLLFDDFFNKGSYKWSLFCACLMTVCSRPHRATWLEAYDCSGRSLGYSHSCILDCTCLL